MIFFSLECPRSQILVTMPSMKDLKTFWLKAFFKCLNKKKDTPLWFTILPGISLSRKRKRKVKPLAVITTLFLLNPVILAVTSRLNSTGFQVGGLSVSSFLFLLCSASEIQLPKLHVCIIAKSQESWV